jgi:hypothetical protein
MKNRKLFPFVGVLLIVSLSCNFLFPTSNNADLVPDELNHIFDNLPAYDPAAPLPSSGAAALDALTELNPSVAVLKDDVQASEREALNALLADLQIQLGAETGTEVPFLFSQSGSAKAAIPAAAVSFPADHNLLGDLDGSGNFSFEAMFVAILTSQVIDQLAVTAGAGEDKSATGTEGGATTNSGIKFKKNPDGSTSLEIVNKTDASKDGVASNTDGKVSIDGWRCPNEAGQVSFTIKERFNAGSDGASYTADLTAYVRAEVNDNAELAGITIDINQGTQKVKDGRTVSVESGVTNKNGIKSNQHVVSSSQEASADDVSNLSAAGEDAAYNMALGALLFAESNWQKGGCVKIEATSPGTVRPGSTTPIPVTVRHRIDSSVVPSKLEAALSGGQSVSPTKLAKTPGTLTYTAPNENGKSATIKLTATSRRGRATLELTASTGGEAYRVSGLSTGVTYSGEICSLEKPFVLNGTFPNGSETLSFTPSNATGGTVEESGESGGCTNSGGGSYTVTLNEQGSGELQWTDTITSSCPPYSTTKTLTFSLPLIPAPDLSCP